MLNKTESIFPPHGLQPVLATDSGTGTVYDVAPFICLIKRYKELETEDEPLWQKIENCIRIVMQWVDADAEIRVVQELHQIMFELRDVTRDSKEFCPQSKALAV